MSSLLVGDTFFSSSFSEILPPPTSLRPSITAWKKCNHVNISGRNSTCIIRFQGESATFFQSQICLQWSMIIEGEWYDHWGMSMVPKCKWWSYLVHCIVIALAQSLRKWFMPSLDLQKDAFVEQMCRIWTIVERKRKVCLTSLSGDSCRLLCRPPSSLSRSRSFQSPYSRSCSSSNLSLGRDDQSDGNQTKATQSIRMQAKDITHYLSPKNLSTFIKVKMTCSVHAESDPDLFALPPISPWSCFLLKSRKIMATDANFDRK